jgi:antitoxin (DNA-binding transcriptional repressor) of toxin-antitoxin stability system
MQQGLNMTTITLEKAQAELPDIVKRVLAGEEILIEADDRRVRLSPVLSAYQFDEATAHRRGYGCMKGQFVVGEPFFEPLPENKLKFWEGQSQG